jgi:hypothetical protein
MRPNSSTEAVRAQYLAPRLAVQRSVAVAWLADSAVSLAASTRIQ